MISPITRKLLSYFFLIILVFSLFTGAIFIYASRVNFIKSGQAHSEEQAIQVSQSITNLLSFTENLPGQQREKNIESAGHNPNSRSPHTGAESSASPPQGRQRNSPGQYFLSWMNELLSSNIRIVDLEEGWVDVGLDQIPVNYDELSEEEKEIVQLAVSGQTKSYIISSLWDETIHFQVATPLRNLTGDITGVLLFYDNLTWSTSLMNASFAIFALAVLIGLGMTSLLALYFARRFIRPIKIINAATTKLAEGNYQVSTGVDSQDELGELGRSVDQLARRLEEARRQTAQLDQMKDDFIASMSHELKTPVTVIKSSLEALSHGLITDPTELKDYHRILYQESINLEELIQSLLDLNILRNGKYKLKKEKINLIEVLEDAIRSQRPLAKQKQVLLEKAYSTEAVYYQADYGRLRQMLITVLNNAIKYSPAESRVIIERIDQDKASLIKVSNFGEEIEAASLQHIFEPFVRGQKHSQPGSGLGLAIAKEIADLHGVGLSLESHGGKTAFSFAFPKSTR